MVLRDQESPWIDFWARVKFGFLVASFIFVISWVHVELLTLRDTRMWRDITGVTPFTDVVITRVETSEHELTVWGTLIKQRDCQTFALPIAQVVVDGVQWPAEFIIGESPSQPSSRPVSAYPQEFGPWTIRTEMSWPDLARMYRTHNCDGEFQTNEVFSQEWIKP